MGFGDKEGLITETSNILNYETTGVLIRATFVNAWFDMVESLEATPELQRGRLLLSTRD